MKKIIFLLFLPFLGFAQTRDSTEINRLYDLLFDQYYYSNYDSASLVLDKIESIATNDQWWDEVLYAQTKKRELAAYHNDFNGAGAAIQAGDVTLDKHGSTLLLEHIIRFKVNKGLYLHNLGFFQQSADVYQDNIDQFSTTPPSNDFEQGALSNAYRGKARALSKLGKLDSAIKLYQKSELIETERAKNGNKGKLGLVLRFLASTYAKKGDIINADKYYRKALDISIEDFKKVKEKKGRPLNRLIYAYSSYAQFLQANNKPKEALKHFNKALEYSAKRPSPDIETQQLLGHYFIENKNYDKAIASYQASQRIRATAFGQNNFKTTQAKTGLANALSLKGNHQAALQTITDALNDFSTEHTSQSKTDNTPLKFVQNKKEYLHSLKTKSDILYRSYTASNDPSDLEAAIVSTQLATEAIDDIRLDFSSDADKMFLSKTSWPIYELGIELEHIAYQQTGEDLHINRAFDYAEKSKSLTLLEAFRSVDQFARLPQATLEKERQIKVAITNLKTKIEKAKAKNKDHESLKAQLLRKEDLYADFLFELEQKHPDYFETKYRLETIPSISVQSKILKKGQAMIQYVLGEKQGYIMAITPDKQYFEKIPNALLLKSNIRKFRTAITTFPTQDFAVLGNELYRQLLHPLEKNLEKEGIQELIIVPDKQLSYLPFDILLTKKAAGNRFKNYPYLIKKHPIAYAYSASLLAEQNQKNKADGAEGFAAFAPQYEVAPPAQDELLAALVREGLYDLKGAQSEAQTLQKMVGGDLFLAQNAHEANFKNTASKYKVLHLAMHSLVNDKNPLFSKLLFTPSTEDPQEDQELNAIELYGMPLQADLAVLSACNTGMGKIEQGEGVMSLSRAFTYAGVPSTVMSLWKVPDEATSNIMVDFYTQLQEGQNIHHALQSAKLEYLQNIEEPELAHPYYWAGFLPAGKMEPVSFTSSPTNIYFWFGLGIFTFLVLVLLGKRKG